MKIFCLRHRSYSLLCTTRGLDHQGIFLWACGYILKVNLHKFIINKSKELFVNNNPI